MPPPTLPHPEFEDCTQAKVARSLLTLLRADTPLKTYCGQIADYELEQLATNADSVQPPALVVVLDAWEEDADGSNRQVKLTTLVELLLLHPADSAVGTDQFLQTRILAHIVRLVSRAKGVLLDEDGNRLTENLLKVQRVQQGTRVGVLVGKRLQLLFTSRINADSGDFLP